MIYYQFDSIPPGSGSIIQDYWSKDPDPDETGTVRIHITSVHHQTAALNYLTPTNAALTYLIVATRNCRVVIPDCRHAQLLRNCTWYSRHTQCRVYVAYLIVATRNCRVIVPDCLQAQLPCYCTWLSPSANATCFTWLSPRATAALLYPMSPRAIAALLYMTVFTRNCRIVAQLMGCCATEGLLYLIVATRNCGVVVPNCLHAAVLLYLIVATPQLPHYCTLLSPHANVS